MLRTTSEMHAHKILIALRRFRESLKVSTLIANDALAFANRLTAFANRLIAFANRRIAFADR